MEKKLRKSKLVIALYVIAALLLVYTCYLIGSTVAYIVSYYSSYSMTPAIGETVAYVLQAAYQPLVLTVVVFAAGYILNEVRALNPGYYATDEEIKAAKAAKKEAKKAAKVPKTADADAEAVEADADAETPKAEAKKNPKEVTPKATMTKAELLEIAKVKGVQVTEKNTKAEILEALNK